MTSLPDLPGPGRGPLGGIAAALAHAQRKGYASVLTIGCDMPDVPAGLLAALVGTNPSYCPEAPILGHWPAAQAADLVKLLSAPAQAGAQGGNHRSRDPGLLLAQEHGGGRSVRGWATAVNATPIPAPAPLRNINTPADLPA